MRLQFISDIHLERRSLPPKVKKNSRYIAALGDIGNPWDPKYYEFLKDLSLRWERVFLLAGNHEYYFGKNIPKTELYIREMCETFKNVSFMQRTIFDLGDYSILGLTMTPPYKCNVPIHRELGKEFTYDEKWLEDALGGSRKKIVLSHYLPSKQLIIEPYKSKYSLEDQERWALSKEHHFGKNIKYWLCGHSHCKTRKIINGVECRINASSDDEYVDL